jgi:hypothetical protein
MESQKSMSETNFQKFKIEGSKICTRSTDCGCGKKKKIIAVEEATNYLVVALDKSSTGNLKLPGI